VLRCALSAAIARSTRAASAGGISGTSTSASCRLISRLPASELALEGVPVTTPKVLTAIVTFSSSRLRVLIWMHAS
jgi:hypothetical protein